MKVLKSEKKLGAVEATTFLVEFLFTLKMVEKLSSIDESNRANQSVKRDKARVAHARKHEIQLLLRLKAKLEWHNERTRHPGEY
jgi:hypothetical protein